MQVKFCGEDIGSIVEIDGHDYVIDRISVNGCATVTFELLEHPAGRPGEAQAIRRKQLRVTADKLDQIMAGKTLTAEPDYWGDF